MDSSPPRAVPRDGRSERFGGLGLTARQPSALVAKIAGKNECRGDPARTRPWQQTLAAAMSDRSR
jgi:hypothetical protein